jgi:hypothetical protein
LRRKVNGRYFYSTYHVVVFHFVEQFLGSFRGNYNLIKNVTTSEQTDEVFYHHVAKVQVTADTTNYSLAPGEALEHAKTFKLGIANGEDISVRINDQQVKATEEIISLGDNAVANIRAMLRRYKDLPATA